MSLYNGGSQQSGKLVVLNTKHLSPAKEPIDPHFVAMEKNAEGKWEEVGTYRNLKAKLVKVTPETKEYKKDGKVVDEKEMVKLLFASEDSDESYLLSLTYRMASRDFFNSLLGLETYDGLEISYYRNKKGFEKLSLKQGGEWVEGKFTYDELKEKIKYVEIRKKMESDPSELNDFLREELKTLNEKISQTPKTEPAHATNSSPAVNDDELDF